MMIFSHKSRSYMHIYSRKHIAHLLLFKPQHTLPLIAHLALLYICPREDIWSAVAPNILLTSIQMMRTSGRAEYDRVVGIQGPKCGTFDLASFDLLPPIRAHPEKNMLYKYDTQI